MAQAHGIGGLEANSVLMGWSNTPSGRALQINLMRNLVGLRKSILLLQPDLVRGFGERKRIHVWWQGKGGNADLMLLLTHLIRQHRDWQEAEVRLLRVIDNEKGREATIEHMEKFLAAVRVNATPVVLTRSQTDEPVSYVIRRNSQHADLTLLGMRLAEEGAAEAYAERLHSLIEGVGAVLLVHNAQPDDELLSG